MRRLGVVFFALFALILSTSAQNNPRQSNITGMQVVGQAVAAEFGRWEAQVLTQVSATGSRTVSVEGSAFVVQQGMGFMPLSTLIPIRVDDGPNSETLTPSSVSCSQGSGICNFTATFTATHKNNYKIKSATNGLQEAIEFMKQRGGQVLVTSDWGGSTSYITGANGYTNVSILDTRSGGNYWYAWDGNDYAVTFGFASSGSTVPAAISTAQRFNNIRYCNQFSGATAGAKITAAIADLATAGGVIDCRGLEGAQTISSTIAVNKPIHLLLGAATISAAATAFNVTAQFMVDGSGVGNTTFQQTDAAATIFSVATTSPFILSGVGIIGTPQTSNAAIILNGSGSSNQFSRIQDCLFRSQWVGIDVRGAVQFRIKNNQFDGTKSEGIRISNGFTADDGDNNIEGNGFFADTAYTTTGIHYLTGGGLSIIGNKFVQLARGLLLDWSSNGGSSQLQVVGNQFDSNGTDHIRIQRAGGYSGTFAGLVISSNYFDSSTGAPANGVVFASDTSAWATFAVVSGNHINLGTSAAIGLDFQGYTGDVATVSGNDIYGQSTSQGIHVGKNYGSVQIGTNNILVGSGGMHSFATGTITGATNATPIVITSSAHSLAVNDLVTISGVGGTTAANGNWLISAVTTNTFTLSGSVGNGAYTAGGSWLKASQRGIYLDDKTCVGCKDASVLSEQLTIPNDRYLATYNAAGTVKKLIGKNASDNVIIGDDANIITLIGGPIKISASTANACQLNNLKIFHPNLTPAAVAANTTAVQSFAVVGLLPEDKLIITPAGVVAGLLQGASLAGTDIVQIVWSNSSAGALTPTSGVYDLIAFRCY